MPRRTPNERLQVGYVGKAHGLRGELNIRLITDRSERADVGNVLYAGDRALLVVASKPHQKGYIVAFDGVEDRNAAEELRGSELCADRIEDDDALWVHELIGATVEELDGTERGTVESVQENPASDLLVTNDGALVPLTFLVERRGDVLVVDVPAGLFEINQPAEPDSSEPDPT